VAVTTRNEHSSHYPNHKKIQHVMVLPDKIALTSPSPEK
jgi:hypothetical protein